ncbi:unnamed protein product [Euphydryas editha]|uniref:SCP domain-containing protein n=1 Tax=Euphydryas editha TaxID=104508 RepID=A0AAU9V263_EUPED|nr:unnamed protein product [Euphydryas editha]
MLRFRSLGNKSNQFTQLIWANTEKIGCGKAKFIVNNFKTTIAERLVCNFAPKGNIHGKPVYIIGYAATQCSDNMQPDSFFSGLCSRKDQTNEIFNTRKASSGVVISSTPVATSLLRIRNLFNDSTVNEIDPVYSNLKLMENETKKECLQINKKSSSIVSQDIFFDAVKRSNPLNNEHFWINYKNNSYDNYNFHQHDKGYSRVYHGHEHKNEFDSIRSENDFTTTLPTYKEQDYRKHNINPQCTRNMKSMVAKFYKLGNKKKNPLLTKISKIIITIRLNLREEENTIRITGSNSKRSIPEDDLNYKPFWQIDDYTNKKKQQQKSIRYTTLGNRKNKKSKTTKRTSKMVFKTEHITLKFNNEQKSNSNRVTEKYLSFDELMHLRKFNTGNYSGRRLLDTKPSDNEGIKLLRESDTTKSTQSTEYTANTPFIRMKHCTRKLTCTWTAASLTDSAGSIIPGEAGNIGSRTPPGYVEGCTRTSTCTRDYMNRNKMATLHIETTTPEFDTGDDEDYCERRSLNRRNSNESTLIKINENITSNENSLNISAIDEVHHVSVSFDGCICDNNNIRNKRNHLNQNSGKETLLNYRNIKREKNNGQNIYERNILSYGDLFYYVLNKFFNNLKSKNSLCVKNNCVCNNTNTVNYLNLLTYLSLFLCVCHYLFML